MFSSALRPRLPYAFASLGGARICAALVETLLLRTCARYKVIRVSIHAAGPMEKSKLGAPSEPGCDCRQIPAIVLTPARFVVSAGG
jgi:hypothetical protein